VGVLANDDAWDRIGRELKRCDPKRYLALLKVAEDICSIHRDPLGESIPVGCFVFPKVTQDEFD
jgi:hypothetical protein